MKKGKDVRFYDAKRLIFVGPDQPEDLVKHIKNYLHFSPGKLLGNGKTSLNASTLKSDLKNNTGKHTELFVSAHGMRMSLASCKEGLEGLFSLLPSLTPQEQESLCVAINTLKISASYLKNPITVKMLFKEKTQEILRQRIESSYDSNSAVSFAYFFYDVKQKLGKEHLVQQYKKHNIALYSNVVGTQENLMLIKEAFEYNLPRLEEKDRFTFHLYSCYGGAATYVSRVIGPHYTLLLHCEPAETSLMAMNTEAITMQMGFYDTVLQEKQRPPTPEESFIHALLFGETIVYAHNGKHFTARPQLHYLSDEALTGYLESEITRFNIFCKDELHHSEEMMKDRYIPEITPALLKRYRERVLMVVMGRMEYCANKEYFNSALTHIQNGVDPNTTLIDNTTLLYLTLFVRSQIKREALIEGLVEKNVDLNKACPSNDGIITPLVSAIHENKTSTVALLLKKGANPNITYKSKGNERSPLAFACAKDNMDIACALLEHGANINWQDSQGKTPLHHAYETGKLDIIKLLIENGADPTIESTKGESIINQVARNILSGKTDEITDYFYNENTKYRALVRERLKKISTGKEFTLKDVVKELSQNEGKDWKIDSTQLWEAVAKELDFEGTHRAKLAPFRGNEDVLLTCLRKQLTPRVEEKALQEGIKHAAQAMAKPVMQK